MSENTNERLTRYAEAIQLANNTETRTAAAHRVMAVADAEFRAQVPEGWHVVNPRYMAELKAAEAERDQARSLAATLEAQLAQVEALAKQAYPVPVSAGGGNLVRHVRVVPIADIFAILNPQGDA